MLGLGQCRARDTLGWERKGRSGVWIVDVVVDVDVDVDADRTWIQHYTVLGVSNACCGIGRYMTVCIKCCRNELDE